MKILAIETATEACSAALLIDGTVTDRFQVAPREHTRLILPMVESLLGEAGLVVGDLSAVAFGRGPGSFTGVRIAAGVVQGLAMGADLPVVPVSSLAAMAQNYFDGHDQSTVYTALDARMNEVYWGVFARTDAGRAELVGDELIISPRDVQIRVADGAQCAGIGSGWETYGDILLQGLDAQIQCAVDAECYPHAAAVAMLGLDGYKQGLAVAPELALPVYLRDKVARKMGE